MKKAIKFLFLGLLVWGCSWENDTSDTEIKSGSNYLIAKVDGVEYKAVVEENAYFHSGMDQDTQYGDPTKRAIIFIFINENKEQFTLTIYDYTGPGTYPAGGENSKVGDCQYRDGTFSDRGRNIWINKYAEPWGEIIITEDSDGRIKGNFKLKVKDTSLNDTKTITDGKFDMKIIHR